MAVRIAFSLGTLVSRPGLPNVVTRPKPVDNAVPLMLLNCGMLPTVVEDGVEMEEPPLLVPQGAPASTMLPLASHLAQSLLTPATVALAYFEPFPEAMPVVMTVLGRRAADNVPLAILAALVVSVVADAARPVTPLAGTDVAAIEPAPLAESDAPEPMTMAALVFVPPAKELNEAVPPVPDPVPQGAPASTRLPFASHLAQFPLAPGAGELTVDWPLPVKINPKFVRALTGFAISLKLFDFCRLADWTAAAAPAAS